MKKYLNKVAKKIYLILLLIIVITTFSFQDSFFEIAKQIEIYNNIFKTLNINYIDRINPGDLITKSIKSTLKDLDPYTRFYNEQQMEDVRIRREGEYGGIGIYSKFSDKGIIIVEIIKDGTADKSNLKPGDLITKVNNQELKLMDPDLLSQVFKGVPNTPITITVNRFNKKFNVKLKLDKIKVSPVPFFGMINSNIGYIKLDRFTFNLATNDLKKAFLELEKKGMKKLVFDLRGNPGGSLSDAVNITNLFIEKGKKVVYTIGKTSVNSQSYITKNFPLDIDIPIVVLIDNRSASASEIVSGALQDYDRAVIMGSRSFGKGLVQRFYKLNYGTQMKATISKYYTPSGRCIQELDYSNRDKKTGKVPKFSDGIVNEFKTKNGRKVYDGGGILPDILIKKSKINQYTKDLLASSALFNYATDFVRKNPNKNINSFNFDLLNFNDFKKYLKLRDTTFVTKQEKLFEKAYKAIKNKKVLYSEYNKLKKQLTNIKIENISKNKDIIYDRLKDEILKQYFYNEGVYKYHIKNDKTIKDAAIILSDNKKYLKILGK